VRHLLLRIAFAAAALASPLPARAAPQDPAAPAPDPPASDATERLRLARERWTRLTPEERQAVLRRYEEFRRLPADKRDALRKRLDEMGGREGAALVRRRLRDLRARSPEQVERLRMQAEALRRIEERLGEDLPPRAEERLRSLTPEVRDRMRRRFADRVLAIGREAAQRKYATDEERAAMAAADPVQRKEAIQSFRRRARDQVLAPHRDELAALPPEERRRREFALLEKEFWSGVREQFAEVRAAFLRTALEPGPSNGRQAPPSPEAKERFAREFGVPQESLPWWAPRSLRRAAVLTPPAERDAFLQKVRPELRRIADLPAAEREAALRALLEPLRGR
jgi:hypothetical protein